MAKKKSGSGTSDTRHPYHEYKPDKKEYYRQLPIPGLVYGLKAMGKKKFKNDPLTGPNEA